MNKIFKYGTVLMMSALAVLSTSCTDEYEYDPTTDVDTSGAYILSDNTDLLFSEGEAQSLTFTVTRHDTIEAKSYKLYISEPDVASIPEEVSFAALEKSKTITVALNVEPGTINKKVVIGINEGDSYMYGANSQTYTISCLRKVQGCTFTTAMLTSPVFLDVDVYEYGKTEKENPDGTVTTTCSYVMKDPYAEIIGPDGVGYNIVFSLNNNGEVSIANNQILFYASAEMTGDASIVGDIIISGGGSYYKEKTNISSLGTSAENFILFNWTMLIGNTGYGYGTKAHVIQFPSNYDPTTQTVI
ncbi:hypothetical protein [uncultured Prevotella sp.]|uniref:hypothetical protein n=1 Tax=uncultured Prevotella sp. TaxID=159272 RepID=UPI00262EC26E|nr:hypothetical protein [uncultured Prevotella sp.]